MEEVLDQNLSIIDFDKNLGIIKKENFIKMRIPAKLLDKKSYRKIDRNLEEINLSFKEKSIASTLQVFDYKKKDLFKKDLEEISVIDKKTEDLKIQIDQEKSKGKTNEKNIKIFVSLKKEKL